MQLIKKCHKGSTVNFNKGITIPEYQEDAFDRDEFALEGDLEVGKDLTPIGLGTRPNSSLDTLALNILISKGMDIYSAMKMLNDTSYMDARLEEYYLTLSDQLGISRKLAEKASKTVEGFLDFINSIPQSELEYRTHLTPALPEEAQIPRKRHHMAADPEYYENVKKQLYLRYLGYAVAPTGYLSEGEKAAYEKEDAAGRIFKETLPLEDEDLEGYNSFPERNFEVQNDPLVLEFFDTDVYPRYLRENPNASEEELSAVRKAYREVPQKLYYANPEFVDREGIAGFLTSNEPWYNEVLNMVGISLEGLPEIYYNTYYVPNRPAIVHENTHAYRLGFIGYPYRDSEKVEENKSTGYTPKELKYMKDFPTEGFNDSFYGGDPWPHYIAELGTTSAENRYKWWRQLRKELGRTPTIDETDEYIKTIPDQDVENAWEDSNAYGAWWISNGVTAPTIKNTMIHVALNSPTSEKLEERFYAKNGIKLIKKLKKI